MLPVVLNITGKKVVVFGGGNVASRKVKKLVHTGCYIVIISKDFSKDILQLKMQMNDKVRLIRTKIDENVVKENIEDCFLAIIATNDKGLNDMIEEICKKKNILINRVDKVSDVIFTADLRYDDIIISISSSGKFPGLSRYLKKIVDQTLGDMLKDENLKLLIDVRKHIIKKVKDEWN